MLAGLDHPTPLDSLRRLGHTVCASSLWLFEERVFNALSRRLPLFMDEYHVPGVQCAFCVRGRPIRSASFGFRDAVSLAPLSCGTPFLLGSLSKPVTALIFLELAAQGKLNLDCPLADLVDADFADSLHEGAAALTCRQLLTHAAQVPHVDSAMFTVAQARTPDFTALRFERTTIQQYLDATIDPSIHSRTYSSRGYAILQVIVEKHFNTAFNQIARSTLLDRLDSRASFDPESACQPAIARDHDEDGQTLPQVWTPVVASSGLVASAADLAAIMAYALTNRHHTILRSLFARPSNCSAPYTCGLHIWKNHDESILDRGGARPGMRGVLKVFPSIDTVFIMLTNGARGVELSRTFVGLVEELARARMSLYGD